MSVQGKTAYVTGGGSGIGRAVTEMLVSKGIKVFIVDTNTQNMRHTTRDINANFPHDPRVYSAEVDVSEWQSQVQAWKTAVGQLGKIDYVFPIAGVGERQMFKNRVGGRMDDEYERPNLATLEVDLVGVIYTVGLAVQHFRRRRGIEGEGFAGKIICTASVCGFYIYTPLPVYTAAKHGVVGFVRSYGKILAEETICTLNAICPNMVRTNIGTTASYDAAEAAGVLVPVERVVKAFEMCMEGGEMERASGECLEVGPGMEGVRVVPKAEEANELVGVSERLIYERSKGLHALEE